MFTAVITGGIATGKSSFTRLLADSAAASAARARVFSCDEAVHELYGRAEVLAEICQAVGLAWPRPEGESQGQLRGVIRAVVTQEAAAKLRLEEVLHPRVFAALEEARAEAQAEGADVFLAEVPLYYESPRRCSADSVIVVAASRETQLRRLMSCRGLDRETSERLLGIQFRLEDKAAQADRVVWNDGAVDLSERQAAILLREILTR